MWITFCKKIYQKYTKIQSMSKFGNKCSGSRQLVYVKQAEQNSLTILMHLLGTLLMESFCLSNVASWFLACFGRHLPFTHLFLTNYGRHPQWGAAFVKGACKPQGGRRKMSERGKSNSTCDYPGDVSVPAVSLCFSGRVASRWTLLSWYLSALTVR